MSKIKFKGKEINTSGNLPQKGEQAKSFVLVSTDLKEKSLQDYQGKKVILNIFPSVDTGVCATSVRKFNEKAAGKENTVVLCISKDLPFAQSRFCAAEGIENVELLSAYRSNFGIDYGVEMVDGPLKALLSRVVLVLDEQGKVIYHQQVEEVTEEPNYDEALSIL